ncbi:autotransporter outer membrane beta-barrel domain-containing protein, partial [Roseomonas hellenica]|nr:autotransporter outer membrane beta-barrel domain-containing protein [Plastoroseomonas hellenica]
MTAASASGANARMHNLKYVALVAPSVLIAFGMAPASAACVTNGTTITCDATTPQSTIIGGGDAPAGDGTTVLVQSNASVAVGDSPAISLRDGANITVSSGATVSATAVATAGGYGTGGNTIEVRSRGTITIDQGGSVLALGTQGSGEAINLQGGNNTVTNNGLIRAFNAAAIWIQSSTGVNTIVNNATGVIQAPGAVLGVSGTATIDFTNHGQVIGDLVFADGDDFLHIFTGSQITGTLSGGGGSDNVVLSGTGSDAISGTFAGFELLTKNDSGTWTITGAITGPTAVIVDAGTLIITGDNSAYAGSVSVNPAGTLQGRAQVLPQAITDNGLVRFAQTDDGTYAGLITGTGAVEKTGAGVLTLAPAAVGGNTYSGGTIITQGVLAIAADNAIGAATGPLTFN